MKPALCLRGGGSGGYHIYSAGSFWFDQLLVVSGVRNAFLSQRIGNLLLRMGVIATYSLTGSGEFEDLAAWAKAVQAGSLLADLALIPWWGCWPVGKSA